MPVIRSRSLIPIIEIIRRYDLAPEEVIAPLGIDISVLGHPKYEDRLELHKAYDLLEVAAEKTGCYFLGALIGNEEKLSFLGPIGLLMEHSPDVETALQVMLKNRRIQQESTDVQLATYGNRVSLSLIPRDITNREGARHFTEAGIYTLVKILQIITGPDFRADRICFAHAAPGDISPYRRLALTKVSFSEEENAIIFSKEYLSRKKGRLTRTWGRY